MNWTGGHLRQSRRSGTTSTAKQRNYFARARASLDKPPSPPHFDLEHAQQDHEASKRRHHHPAPSAERLPPTRTHAVPGSSPRPAVRKRKADKLLDLDTEEGLFVKRMEILDKLNKREWFNNPTPKPLKISFPSSNEVRMIGRRRKLTEEEKIRHEERMRARKQSIGVRIGSTLTINRTIERVPNVRPEDARHASSQHSRLQQLSLKSIPSSASDPMLLDGDLGSVQRIRQFGITSPLNVSTSHRFTEASTDPTRLDTFTTFDKTQLGRGTQSFSWDPLTKTAGIAPSDLMQTDAGHSLEDDVSVDLPKESPLQDLRLVFDSLPQLLPTTSSSDSMLLDDDLPDSDRSHAAQCSELSWEGIADSDDRVQDKVNDGVKEDIKDEVKYQAKDEAKDDEQTWRDFVFGFERQEEKGVPTSPPSVEDGTPWRKSRVLRRRQSEKTYVLSSSDASENSEESMAMGGCARELAAL